MTLEGVEPLTIIEFTEDNRAYYIEEGEQYLVCGVYTPYHGIPLMCCVPICGPGGAIAVFPINLTGFKEILAGDLVEDLLGDAVY